MYCAHYHDCNVMKKHCCSFKSDVGVQRDFSDKQHCPRRKITIDESDRYIPKSEKTKEKLLINTIMLILLFCLILP